MYNDKDLWQVFWLDLSNFNFDSQPPALNFNHCPPSMKFLTFQKQFRINHLPFEMTLRNSLISVQTQNMYLKNTDLKTIIFEKKNLMYITILFRLSCDFSPPLTFFKISYWKNFHFVLILKNKIKHSVGKVLRYKVKLYPFGKMLFWV